MPTIMWRRAACVGLILSPLVIVGRSETAARPDTWVSVGAGTDVCGTLLTNNASVDCRALCLSENGYDSAVCTPSVVNGVAANCAISWAFDRKETHSVTTAEDLATCQSLCLSSGRACSAFEFHKDDKMCILRTRYQMYRLVHRHGGGEECSSTEFACDKFFEDQCPTCFGRRVCMRKDENVFFAPRLCVEKEMDDRHRCITFGFAYPLTDYVVPRSLNRSAAECAAEIRADPQKAPPAECALVTPSNTYQDAWQGPLSVMSGQTCGYWIVRRTAAADEHLEVTIPDTSYHNCQQECRKLDDCVWFQWTTETTLANFDHGRCMLMTDAAMENSFSKGRGYAAVTAASGPVRCIDRNIAYNVGQLRNARDPDFEPPLGDNEVRVESIAVCDRLISRDPRSADVGASCVEDCYTSRKYNTSKCSLAVDAAGEPLECVARAVGSSTAVLERKPVSTLAECSDRCSARSDCAAWEVDVSVKSCALKSWDHVVEDQGPWRSGGGNEPQPANLVTCNGVRSMLEKVSYVYRGNRGCAVPEIATDDRMLCVQPHLPVASHLLGVARWNDLPGAECWERIAADPAAAVPFECVRPGPMQQAPAAEGSDWIADANFPAERCHQAWGYGPLTNAAATDVNTGECQDLCRSADACLYWMWELVDGFRGNCYLKTARDIREALADGAPCTVPDGGVKLDTENDACVYSHRRLVSAPRQCINQSRSPTSIDDMFIAAGTSTTTSTTTPTTTTTTSTSSPTTTSTSSPTTTSTSSPTTTSTSSPTTTTTPMMTATTATTTTIKTTGTTTFPTTTPATTTPTATTIHEIITTTLPTTAPPKTTTSAPHGTTAPKPATTAATTAAGDAAGDGDGGFQQARNNTAVFAAAGGGAALALAGLGYGLHRRNSRVTYGPETVTFEDDEGADTEADAESIAQTF